MKEIRKFLKKINNPFIKICSIVNYKFLNILSNYSDKTFNSLKKQLLYILIYSDNFKKLLLDLLKLYNKNHLFIWYLIKIYLYVILIWTLSLFIILMCTVHFELEGLITILFFLLKIYKFLLTPLKKIKKLIIIFYYIIKWVWIQLSAIIIKITHIIFKKQNNECLYDNEDFSKSFGTDKQNYLNYNSWWQNYLNNVKRDKNYTMWGVFRNTKIIINLILIIFIIYLFIFILEYLYTYIYLKKKNLTLKDECLFIYNIKTKNLIKKWGYDIVNTEYHDESNNQLVGGLYNINIKFNENFNNNNNKPDVIILKFKSELLEVLFIIFIIKEYVGLENISNLVFNDFIIKKEEFFTNKINFLKILKKKENKIWFIIKSKKDFEYLKSTRWHLISPFFHDQFYEKKKN